MQGRASLVVPLLLEVLLLLGPCRGWGTLLGDLRRRRQLVMQIQGKKGRDRVRGCSSVVQHSWL